MTTVGRSWDRYRRWNLRGVRYSVSGVDWVIAAGENGVGGGALLGAYRDDVGGVGVVLREHQGDERHRKDVRAERA